MPVNTYHLRSSVKGQEPTAGTAQGQLPVGSIAINFNADEPFLTIQDSSGSIRRIAGVKIDSTGPLNPTAGEWWVDTSGATKIVKVFDGTGWVATGSPVVDATTGVKGIAQLADAAAVTAGTAGRVVTADQLKTTNDAVAANTTNITTNAGAITTIQGQITTINGKVTDATTGAKGIVQLADAAAITAGTVGRVVTADQLKATNDAVATVTAGGISTINGTSPVSVTGTGGTRTVAVADASTTAKGVVQLADAAAIIAGTTGRVVDAAQLKANVPVIADASETGKGIVELATAAETTTGTDATRAVHPAGLKVELDKCLKKNIALLPALP
jgi:hypothetical protein